MKYARKLLLLLLAGSLIPAYVYAAQLSDKPELTLDAAKQAAAAAETAAHTKGIAVTVGVVDDGGHLIYLARLDHVASGMTDAAIMKARTAANYGLPTRTLEDAVAQGHVSYLNLPGVLPLEGGLPILIDGRVIGAIGVAGAQSSEDDAAIARAGLATFAR
jgi:glc operon protein GlcG